MPIEYVVFSKKQLLGQIKFLCSLRLKFSLFPHTLDPLAIRFHIEAGSVHFVLLVHPERVAALGINESAVSGHLVVLNPPLDNAAFARYDPCQSI